MYDLWVTINERVDSLALWSDIKQYNVNLTDMIYKSVVYGHCNFGEAVTIILLCRKFSDKVEVSLKKELV